MDGVSIFRFSFSGTSAGKLLRNVDCKSKAPPAVGCGACAPKDVEAASPASSGAGVAAAIALVLGVGIAAGEAAFFNTDSAAAGALPCIVAVGAGPAAAASKGVLPVEASAGAAGGAAAAAAAEGSFVAGGRVFAAGHAVLEEDASAASACSFASISLSRRMALFKVTCALSRVLRFLSLACDIAARSEDAVFAASRASGTAGFLSSLPAAWSSLMLLCSISASFCTEVPRSFFLACAAADGFGQRSCSNSKLRLLSPRDAECCQAIAGPTQKSVPSTAGPSNVSSGNPKLQNLLKCASPATSVLGSGEGHSIRKLSCAIA
mmetsp:Transcript_48799/g.116006  ORF Transcript_48799/g.116006 Transcript_48799/m.116006 type:complete len:321 (+) Transcript_48799:994-1956(+)